MLRPKKIPTRNLMTKKNSCGSKIPLPPPQNFSNGPSLIRLHTNFFCMDSHVQEIQTKVCRPLWTVAWQRSSAFKTIIVFQTKKYDKHWVFVFFEFILSLWGVDSAKKISRKRLGCISKHSFPVLFDHLVVSCFMYASCKGVFNFVRMKDISVGIFSTRVHDHKENYLKLSTT